MLNKDKEKSIIEAFLKTSTGQATAKKLARALKNVKELEEKNQELETKLLKLSALNKELEEKLENGDMLTKEEEIIARSLMEKASSVYKNEKPSRYILSVADDNGQEHRIYSSQVKDILNHLPIEQE